MAHLSLLLSIVTAALCAWAAARLSQPLPWWAGHMAVFAATKVGGDLAARSLNRPEALFFVEDHLRELAGFIAIGALAAAAGGLVTYYYGYALSPVPPAALAYVAFIILPGRRRG